MTPKNKLLIALGGVVLAAVLLVAGFFAYQAIFAEEIKGRIMVVQQNAEVKRLALIKVFAISSRDAEAWRSSVVAKYRRIVDSQADYLADSSTERRAIIGENDSSIGRLESLLAAACECRDAAREFWIVDPNQPSKKRRFFELMVMQGFPSAKEIEQDALSSRWDKCYESLRNSVVPELELALSRAVSRKAAELRKHDAEVAKRLVEFKDECTRCLSHDSLTEIPDTVRKIYPGISDDNGEYSIRLPVGDYYLVARAQRRVFDSTEYYHWARPVSVPSADSKRCLMGNNNMLGSSDRNLWTDLPELIDTKPDNK